MLDEKLIKELTTAVNSQQWLTFLKYVEIKKEETIVSLLSTSGEDTFKTLGKLKLYNELITLRDSINSKHKGN